MSYYLEESARYLEDNGYDIQPSYLVGRGWELVKEHLGMFIGFFLLVFAINLGGNLVPIVGSLAVAVISPVLNAGFYVVAHKISLRQHFEFNDFFKGFDDFAQLFLVSLVSSIFIILGFLLLIVPGIYLAVSYSLAPLLVVFGKMEFWEAMETSRRVVSKNWWSFFGFFLLLVGVNFLGALAFGIGLVVTIPLSYVAIYVVFEDIFNLKGGEDLSIEDHFIE